MLVLFETAAGYAIFKLLDEKKLQKTDNLFKYFESAEAANKILKMKNFEKFSDMQEALTAATAVLEGKLNKKLKKLLKKVVLDANETLAVSDTMLGKIIKKKLNIPCVQDNTITELMRCMRSQMDSLMTGLGHKEVAAMALGLAHSLSRYKLKFSPDKVDTMIVQAISLLDELDRDVNNYVMIGREWYGWHFPELGKIIPDNLAFVKTVKLLGTRDAAADVDFSDILPEDVEVELKNAAEISVGTAISTEDISHIRFLCDQVIEMTDYRSQLFAYLQNRMGAIAPNLTVLVGDIVGARLISHAGSLLNLSKQPASTVQILGAEKALFRAIKARHATPKYGILYHAQMINQCAPKLKGKLARMLAAKTSLACRKDALGEDTNTDLGHEARAKLEIRLKMLEEGSMRRISGTGRMKARMDKYENKSQIRQFKPGGDFTRKRKLEEDVEIKEERVIPEPSKKKFKMEAGGDKAETPVTPTESKKKKQRMSESNDYNVATTPGESKNEIKKIKHKSQ